MLRALLPDLKLSVSLEEVARGEEAPSLEFIAYIFYVRDRPATGFCALVEHPVVHAEATFLSLFPPMTTENDQELEAGWTILDCSILSIPSLMIWLSPGDAQRGLC